MSCINCEEVPKRVNNIFRDEELKEKFESVTGLRIFENLFICDSCMQVLIQSHSFKEKCIEVYERETNKFHAIPEAEHFKTEVYEEYLDSSKEEHLDEEEIETVVYEPFQKAIPQISPKQKVRLKYTLKEKLDAVELAEQSTNRNAAKLLTIDESCIRKWRHQKEQIKRVDNPQACKVTKNLKLLTESVESEQNIENVEEEEIECEIQTEVMDDTVTEQIKPREIKTRKSYTSGEKLEVVAYAEIAGNRQAGKIYNIDESCIRKWRNQKCLLEEIHKERGTKRKPNLRFPEIEKQLKNFVLQKLDKGVKLKPSEIKNEAVRIAHELNITSFKGTSSYIFKFMERYNFSSNRVKNSKALKNIKESPHNEITNDDYTIAEVVE